MHSNELSSQLERERERNRESEEWRNSRESISPISHTISLNGGVTFPTLHVSSTYEDFQWLLYSSTHGRLAVLIANNIKCLPDKTYEQPDIALPYN